METIAAYETWLRSWTSSEQTIHARVKVARGRVKAWGPPDTITAEQIQGWLGRPGLSRWSRQTYYAALSDFFAWCEATGHIKANPMSGVRKPTPGKSSPRPLSDSEVTRVLTSATGNVRAWVLLAMLAGLRAHEIAKIRGEDVTPEGIYVEGKGGTRTTLPCHPDLWKLAQFYPRRGYWFPSPRGGHICAETVSNGTGKFFRELGITGSIHRCRHVYATRLLRAGVNIRVVQRLMRHATLATTAVYTAVDEDEMRAAVERLSA